MNNKKSNKSMGVKVMAALAMLCALSIILGKYLQIPVGDVLRFSFENLPIIFAGIVFGPVSGMLVGTVSDLIGCLLVGYAINPIVTLGAALCGGISGITAMLMRYSRRIPNALKACISVICSHLVGSVLIKTFGLAKFYDMPLGILMLWRLLNYAIVGALECVLLSVLLKSPAISKALGSIKEASTRKRVSTAADEKIQDLNEDEHNG